MLEPQSIRRYRRPHRYFFIWFLPVLWVCVAAVARSHPGDEYGLFLGGSVAGFWVEFLFREQGNVYAIMTRVMLAGAMTVSVAGWILDLLRVPRKAWFLLWMSLATFVCWYSVASFPSYANAITKNGSLTAYVCLSMNLGLYVSTILLMIAAPIVGWWRKPSKPGRCIQCGYDLCGNTSGRCPECGLEVK